MVMDEAKINNIIHLAHKGIGDTSEAVCLSGHRGNSTMSIVNKRFCFKIRVYCLKYMFSLKLY